MLRKFYHLGGLFFVAAALYISPAAAKTACGIMLGIIIGVDVLRLNISSFNNWLFSAFPGLFKEKERNSFSGSPYFLGGVLLSLVLFDVKFASCGIVILCFGDSSASLIGSRIGRIRIADKSLEGSIAFIIAATLFVYILTLIAPEVKGLSGIPLKNIFTASAVCALLELIPAKYIDDNLVIPVAGSFILKLLN